MVEAKGTGYAAMLAKGKPCVDWILDDWRGRAENQTSAAKAQGRPVFWFLAEERAAEDAQALFKDKRLNITVIYMPMPGAKP